MPEACVAGVISRGALRVSLGLLLAFAATAHAQIYTRVNADGVVEATNIPELGFRLTYPGKGTLIHSRGFRSVVYRGQFDSHIQAAAALYGVAEAVIKAVIQVESEFDHMAVSSKGAEGLMQLMPFTARRFGVSNSFDPRQNIFGGTQYLRLLLDLFSGDLDRALAGYNAGENAVLRFGGIPPYKETREYVRKVRVLLGGDGPALALATQAVSFVPSGALAARSAARPAQKLAPAKPRLYYRWHDEAGRLHVATEPPAEGITYAMLRPLD